MLRAVVVRWDGQHGRCRDSPRVTVGLYCEKPRIVSHEGVTAAMCPGPAASVPETSSFMVIFTLDSSSPQDFRFVSSDP